MTTAEDLNQRFLSAPTLWFKTWFCVINTQRKNSHKTKLYEQIKIQGTLPYPSTKKTVYITVETWPEQNLILILQHHQKCLETSCIGKFKNWEFLSELAASRISCWRLAYSILAKHLKTMSVSHMMSSLSEGQILYATKGLKDKQLI